MAQNTVQVTEAEACGICPEAKLEKNCQQGAEGQSIGGTSLIDCLVDDIILIIFSYLSLLRDRGNAARVCKRWNRVMKSPTLWTTVDFWTGGGFDVKDSWRTWQALEFPLDCTLAQEVLQTYPKTLLQHAYLRIADDKILEYLTSNCPNLKTLSFLSQNHQMPLFEESALAFFKKKYIVLPQSLTRLDISSEVMRRYTRDGDSGRKMARGNIFIEINQKVIDAIIGCQFLRHITIANCRPLTKNAISKLTQGLPNLKELWLLYFCDDQKEIDIDGEENLKLVVRNLQHLTSLRYCPHSYCVFHLKPSYDIDKTLAEITNLSKLRELHVCDVTFTQRAFTCMVENLKCLEELVILHSECVTDDILEIIAQLKKLKVLGLPLLLASTFWTPWSTNTYGSRGIIALRNHAVLERLSFYRVRSEDRHERVNINFPASVVTDLFEMLLTLPNLQIVNGIHDCCKHFPQIFDEYRPKFNDRNVRIMGNGFYDGI